MTSSEHIALPGCLLLFYHSDRTIFLDIVSKEAASSNPIPELTWLLEPGVASLTVLEQAPVSTNNDDDATATCCSESVAGAMKSRFWLGGTTMRIVA